MFSSLWTVNNAVLVNISFTSFSMCLFISKKSSGQQITHACSGEIYTVKLIIELRIICFKSVWNDKQFTEVNCGITEKFKIVFFVLFI